MQLPYRPVPVKLEGNPARTGRREGVGLLWRIAMNPFGSAGYPAR